jgi:biotin carboxyl carrier protein
MSEKVNKDPEALKELNIMGDVYRTTFTKKYEKRQPWTKPNEKEVISYIPGTVREVLVKAGDKVTADQKLLVLEAMKMMNSIYSPANGKIKSVIVAAGDCIPKGTVMIEFE